MNRNITSGLLAAFTITYGLPNSASAADVTYVEPIGELPAYIEFTGIVERGDARAVRALVETKKCNLVLITSPGGSAYEGLKLYDTAKDLKLNCVAYGFGAWSAAAMFWMGGEFNNILPDSQVGFHYAYDGYTDEPAPQWWHATVGARVSDALDNEPLLTDITLGKWQRAYDMYGTAGFYVLEPKAKGETGYKESYVDSSSPSSSAPVQVREFMKAKRQTLEIK